MPVHIALLRAVNVGGTGKLPMAELRELCGAIGLRDTRTYIQSGNLVARAPWKPATVKARLERALAERSGKPVRVLVRTPEELERTIAANPFPDVPPARLLILFLDEAPPPGAVDGWPVPGQERLALLGREVFIHFPDGMGASKLRIPFADVGTGRNLNTVRTLLAMARTP